MPNPRETLTAGPNAPCSVVVVSYNVRDPLSRCLASLRRHAPETPVVVVDNGSADGSVEMARRDFPEVHVAASPENLGFGRACNLGVDHTASEFIFFLNPDAQIHAGTIENLLAYVRAFPRDAVVGPRLQDADDALEPSMRDEPTAWNLVVENLPLVRRFSARRDRHERPRRCDWLLGAALMVRREAFLEAGGFDDDIFLYYEDADLCLRLRDLGWEIHFTPSAIVTHVGGASSLVAFGSTAETLVRYARARTRLVKKRNGPWRYGLYWALYSALLGGRWTRAVLGGDKDAAALARRQLSALRGK